MQIRHLGCVDYPNILAAMQAFTEARSPSSLDEIWLCEHFPVFTLGRHADPAHILNAHTIPIVQTDRGGQVTYHGPGQLMVYVLIDLRRRNLGVAALVKRLEDTVIQTLATFNIPALTRAHMPGVYVAKNNNLAKICSVGLRVKRGYVYHGLSLNIAMDLQPFTYINPCGYQNLTMIQMRDFDHNAHVDKVKAKLLPLLLQNLK